MQIAEESSEASQSLGTVFGTTDPFFIGPVYSGTPALRFIFARV